MKILIAVPTFESIYPDTFKSIYDVDSCGHQLFFEYVRGYDCATARNKIAQIAMDRQMDYVLMVDNDVVIPKDAIKNLTDDIKEVTLGYYAHRVDDNLYSGRTCVCKLLKPDGSVEFNYPLESEYLATELAEMRERGEHKIKIHGGGMGCAFIQVDVFRRIKYPYYDWVNYNDAHRGMLSEDLYFCEQCKRFRIPIFTDSRVSCGHMLRHVQYCG